MTKTAERFKAVLAIENQGFKYRVIQEYSVEDLINRMKMVAPAAPYMNYYKESEVIQRELLTNEAFPNLLKKLQETMESVPAKRLSDVIEGMQVIGTRLTDYPFEKIHSALAETTLNNNAVVPFITSFNPDKDTQTIIIDNLNAICGYGDFFLLSRMALALFDKPYLSGYIYAAGDKAVQICEMLSAEPIFQDIAEFLFRNTNDIYFNTYELEKMTETPQTVLNGLKTIHGLLGDAETMELFMNQWQRNCSIRELLDLPERLSQHSLEKRKNSMQSKSAYISLLYGKAVNGIDLTDLNEAQEDIIIYALSAQKRSFVRLIEENTEAFLSLPNNSFLLCREFYTQYINLNALNAKNLKDFTCIVCETYSRYTKKNDSRLKIEWLERRVYTFEEIKALYNLSRPYTLFYNSLSVERVDERLLTLRQVAKKQLLASLETDEEVIKLAAILSERPLYKRIQDDFSHVDDIKASDIIRLLLIQNKIGRFIPHMRDRLDIELVIRNQDELQNFQSLADVKRNLDQIDEAWSNLRTQMGFDGDFVERNSEWISRFLVRNGAQIALTYYKDVGGNLTESQRESFKRIVKAELMGEFATLKYYRDDLALEIDHPVTEKQKELWQQNVSANVHSVTSAEHDDFYSTLLMGVQPQRTCLSYIDGAYRECLLSNFDTNKKILYAEIGGKIVGRAILRLTKGRFSEKSPSKGNETLAFVDVEALPNEDQTLEKESLEHLVLFLERPYTAGVSPEVEKFVYAAFVQLAEKKADTLDAMLVLSQSYSSAAENSMEDYTKTHINLFISRSKAGKQYIDSLNGSVEISDEGSYRSNVFLIRQKDM